MQLSEYPKDGKFQEYGGCFVPEVLIPPLTELKDAYRDLKDDEDFLATLEHYNREYGGRPTPLYYAERLTESAGGAKIYLKREDLLHGGAHKFNNVMGQALIAKDLGKKRLICETGAGQHGVATSLAGAVLGIDTEVYMGAIDAKRQEANLFRMELLGAEVHTVSSGSKTLKNAINAALKDWAANVGNTYYLLGSVVGPHPYPMIVRDFQSVIGEEIKTQLVGKDLGLPDLLVACVGGGSNAMGTFYPFADSERVGLLGAEAGGSGENGGAASLGRGEVGALHGAKSFLLQDEEGQISETHSIAAGLDYPGVGPEHALYQELGRANYVTVHDHEAMKAFKTLCELEGIIPAIESAHAVYAGLKKAEEMSPEETLVITLSGRGDKDLRTAKEWFKNHEQN